MKAARYFVETMLYLFLIPAILTNVLALSAYALLALAHHGNIDESFLPWGLLVAAALCALSVTPSYANVWFRDRFKQETLPRNFLLRYLPLYIPLIFWSAMAFLMRSAHAVGEPLLHGSTFSFCLIFGTHVLYLLWMVPMVFISQEEFLLLYSLPLFLSLLIAAICTLMAKRLAATPSTGKAYGVPLLLAMLIVPSALLQADYHMRFGTVLRPDDNVAILREGDQADRYWSKSDQPDLSVYKPFAEENSRLVTVVAPTLTISEDHPRIAGALAFYPVYAAAVQAVYKDFDAEKQLATHVMVGTSPETFAQLTQRRADMVFMLEPSALQYDEARRNGMTLHLTKVGREAFVFFVNADNPVDGLSSEQIRDVYSRRIVNWRELGGRNRKIMPFQRPEGSGSQTAMIRMMQGRTLTMPIHEERQRSMGGIINRVADYRNYENSIGYSFRFFAESMFQTDGIKLLAVDGVAPTVETIRDGSYPFVYDFYIITNGPPNGKTQTLIDWFLSPQGQRLIEQTGYVPVPAGIDAGE